MKVNSFMINLYQKKKESILAAKKRNSLGRDMKNALRMDKFNSILNRFCQINGMV